MRGFIVLCLAAIAVAAPQYNYQQPSGGFTGASSFQSTSTVGGGGFSHGGGGGFSHGGGGGFSHGGGGGFSHGGGGGFSHGGGGGFSHGGGAGGGGHGGFGGGHDQAAIVSKHFYLHAAPEETEEEARQETISAGPAHKHFRVVFIKAPAQSSKAAAIQFAQAQNEEKTVIYVLSKKTDASELAASVQAAPHVESKPEVFFIKYKTPEEAAHAQRQIQSQYDALGGTSQVSDEGIAPVQSVIGALGGGGSSGGGGFGGSTGGFGGSTGGFGGSTGGFGGSTGGFGGSTGGFGGSTGGFGGSTGGFGGFASASTQYLPPGK